MQEKMNARILLVDDEDEFIKALTQRLEVRGLTVTGATRGQDALDLIGKQIFDIIVLDLAMPGMDGLETLQKIKEKDPDTEIVMLSGQGNIKSGVEAMKLGAKDFLEKPVDLAELLKRIEAAKEKRILILQKRAKKEIGEILQRKSW